MQFENLEKKKERIGNIEKEILYNVISDLPSNKRSYPDIGKIYVRGLFYGEVLEISKINENSLEDSYKIYKDAIKFENSDYSLKDLELVDYILLTSICNIMTTPDFKWHPDFRCNNLIKNPKLSQLEIEKEGLESNLKDLEKKSQEKFLKEINQLKEELSEIEEKIKNFSEDEMVVCNTIVSAPITLDDFEIEIEDPNIIFPIYYNFSGTELELKSLNIQDEIELESYPELNQEIAYLAKHIRNIDFIDAYNLLKNSMPWEVEKLKNQIDRFKISLKPIITRCPRCGEEYEVIIDLKDIKVLPRF